MICVDASTAVKWLLPEEELADHALALLRDVSRARTPIVAPALLPIEVTNTVRQRLRRAQLTLEDAERLLDRFLGLPITYATAGALCRQALRLAHIYRLPAAYDAQYVALAQPVGCSMWTDDRRLLHAVHDALPFVRWIGDYGPDAEA